VKWVGGSALRGRNAPASTSDASGLPNAMAMVTTSRTYTRSLSLPTSSYEPPPTIPLSPSALELDDFSLVGHFSTAVLPRFQLGDETIPVTWELVTKDVPLQQAVLAVARSHYSYLSKCTLSGTTLVRSKARHAAINSFRQRLELGVQTEDAAQDLFTINILLCMLDGMIEPSKEMNASMFHLRGGYAMLNKWENTTTKMILEQGLRAHLLSVFVTMDLVHSLLSGEKPYFDSSIWLKFENIHAWWGKLPSDDRFLSLLDLHTRMASLGSAVRSRPPSTDTPPLLEGFVPVIETALRTSRNDPDSPGAADTPSKKWDIFCTFYEISALIYLQRVLRQRPLDDESVQALTQRGVALLAQHVLPGMMSHCVILPILVIGAHCISVEDRRIISQALSPSLSYLSFGNLPMMAEFLQSTWAKNDLTPSWWELFAPIADKIFLF
jgi:hypothetical protein